VLARLNQPAPELYGRKGLRISGSTSRVIARMLELDAARRYPSWASLQADIREVQSRKNPATVAGRGPSTATHAKKEQARGPGRWIAMGAAVVLLVGVGIALTIARREKAETGSKPAPPQTAPAASVTDQAVLPLSILGDLAMATRRFAEGKAPAMDRELMKLIAKKDQVPAGGGSALWIELIRGMANMSAASRLVYIDQIKAIADTKLGENDRAAAMAIAIAGFVQGTLPAADFEKRAGSWPAWVGEFADLMRGLELIIGGSFDEGMNRCSRFAKSTAGKPEWVENLRTKFAKDQEKIAPVMQALPELKALAAKGPSKELSDRIEALKQDQPRYVQAGLDALIPAPPKAATP